MKLGAIGHYAKTNVVNGLARTEWCHNKRNFFENSQLLKHKKAVLRYGIRQRHNKYLIVRCVFLLFSPSTDYRNALNAFLVYNKPLISIEILQ